MNTRNKQQPYIMTEQRMSDLIGCHECFKTIKQEQSLIADTTYHRQN